MSPFISCRVSQLARALGVTPVVIYRWVERGFLPSNCIVRDGRSVFILGEAFAEFVAAGGLERSYLLRHRAPEVTLAKLQQQQPPEPEAFKSVSQLNMLEVTKPSRSGIQY